MQVIVCLLPCDELVTCPGCTTFPLVNRNLTSTSNKDHVLFLCVCISSCSPAGVSVTVFTLLIQAASKRATRPCVIFKTRVHPELDYSFHSLLTLHVFENFFTNISSQTCGWWHGRTLWTGTSAVCSY